MTEPFEPAVLPQRPSLFYLTPWTERFEGLSAGFTGRDGGVSEGPWGSLNVGLHVGDDPQRVVLNRQAVCDAIGWPFDAWTCAEQVHGCEVRRITPADRGKGKDCLEDAVASCDALMTDEPGILLTSFYADCVPLYFYDPENRAVALAHAGWKGTVLEIARLTIEAMGDVYGSKPERMMAAIGPSIGVCCYEVGMPVIDRVNTLLSNLKIAPGNDFTHMIRYGGKDKAWINLKEINRQIMIKAGIVPINIELTERCTGCHVDLFYSHRIENGNTGRMASWIGMEAR